MKNHSDRFKKKHNIKILVQDEEKGKSKNLLFTFVTNL